MDVEEIIERIDKFFDKQEVELRDKETLCRKMQERYWEDVKLEDEEPEDEEEPEEEDDFSAEPTEAQPSDFDMALAQEAQTPPPPKKPKKKPILPHKVIDEGDF